LEGGFAYLTLAGLSWLNFGLTLAANGSNMSLTLIVLNIESRKEGKVKFLTITSMKDTFSMLPPAIGRQLMEATVAWVNQQKKAGRVLEIYAIPDGRTVTISENPSAEDIAQALAGVPMEGFLNFEVYPLADFNETMKAYIESAKTAEQMFPAKK
jgi:muconolactone delta-isomerase